jgi:hypothetical protein
MSTQSYEELERRVALIERRLTRARAKVLGLGVALGVALAVLLVGPLVPRASAQRTVTRLEAPVLVVNEQGQSIVEISNAPGRYGLTVWGRTGGNTFIGTSAKKDGGLIQLHEPKEKMTTQIGGGGILVGDGGDILVKNTQGVTVAALGAKPEGPGYLALGNAKGDGTVNAGTTASGDRGYVEALPTAGPPPTVIPKYIMGGRTR